MPTIAVEGGILKVTMDDGQSRSWGLAVDQKNNSVSLASDTGEYKTFTYAQWRDSPIACLRSMESGLERAPRQLSPEEKIAILEKRNDALEAALAEKGLITKSDVDVKLAAELDASGLRP